MWFDLRKIRFNKVYNNLAWANIKNTHTDSTYSVLYSKLNKKEQDFSLYSLSDTGSK